MPKMEITRMSFDEWNALGVKLFGEDRKKWRFRCPSCDHVQGYEEFAAVNTEREEAGDKKLDIATVVGFSCIGRWDGHMDNEMCAGKQPCNYTSGGLFNITPLSVEDEEGKPHSLFAFAEEKS